MTMNLSKDDTSHSLSGFGLWQRLTWRSNAHRQVAVALPELQGFGTEPLTTMSTVEILPPASQIEERSQQAPLGGTPKRIMDVAIAAVALVLAAPVMLILVVLVTFTMGGPAIYSHRRVGFGGKPFNCYKFRSMVNNADEVLRDYLANNPDAALEWEHSRKLKRDPRVTLLGQILRTSSLDELPQLFNILKGEMSCVGPRPIVSDELKRYGDKVGEYLQTRPGLTGLWQVTGRSGTEYADRVALDSEYVRGWTVWSDIVILARTVLAVMRFDRAL